MAHTVTLSWMLPRQSRWTSPWLRDTGPGRGDHGSACIPPEQGAQSPTRATLLNRTCPNLVRGRSQGLRAAGGALGQGRLTWRRTAGHSRSCPGGCPGRCWRGRRRKSAPPRGSQAEGWRCAAHRGGVTGGPPHGGARSSTQAQPSPTSCHHSTLTTGTSALPGSAGQGLSPTLPSTMVRARLWAPVWVWAGPCHCALRTGCSAPAQRQRLHPGHLAGEVACLGSDSVCTPSKWSRCGLGTQKGEMQ